MVFGMKSPLNRPVGTNRDAQNLLMPKIKRPINTARPNTFQSPQVFSKGNTPQENEGKDIFKNVSKSGLRWLPKRYEEGKNEAKPANSKEKHQVHASIQEEGYEESDRECQGEDDDDDYDQYQSVSQITRTEQNGPIRIFENDSFEDKIEISSQESRDLSKEKYIKPQEQEKSQFYKLRCSQPAILFKEHLNTDGLRVNISKTPVSTHNNHFIKRDSRILSSGKLEDAPPAPAIKVCLTENLLNDNKRFNEKISEYNNGIIQNIFKPNVVDFEQKTNTKIQSQSRPHRTYQNFMMKHSPQANSSLSPSQRTQNLLWNFLAPKTIELKVERQPVVETSKDLPINTPSGFQGTRPLTRVYIKKDSSKKILNGNNLFANERFSGSNQFSPSTFMRKK